MREQLREPALGTVPLDTDGSAWAVATAGALVVFNGRSGPAVHAWDEVERQRVEAAIIHSAVTTLPSGATATASVRRGGDSELYSVTRPLISQVDEVEDRRALQELENRVREGVGLPTR